MNMESFEEVRVPRDQDWAQFLREGTDCDLVFYNGEVISVEPPQTMTLKVTVSDPAVKGNTAQGARKPATLETGATIEVRHAVNAFTSCQPSRLHASHAQGDHLCSGAAFYRGRRRSAGGHSRGEVSRQGVSSGSV
jgi:hypothetical protein